MQQLTVVNALIWTWVQPASAVPLPLQPQTRCSANPVERC